MPWTMAKDFSLEGGRQQVQIPPDIELGYVIDLGVSGRGTVPA
jgi:hypothetical protein